MNAATARRRLDDPGRAVGRRDEALTVPETAPLDVDGRIQRFEFVFELCGKALKALLKLNSRSIGASSARAVVKARFAAGRIDDEAASLDLLDTRNATSHTDRERVAQEIYGRIKLRAPMIGATLVNLRAQLP